MSWFINSEESGNQTKELYKSTNLNFSEVEMNWEDGKNKVYLEVEDIGQKCVSSRWVKMMVTRWS